MFRITYKLSIINKFLLIIDLIINYIYLEKRKLQSMYNNDWSLNNNILCCPDVKTFKGNNQNRNNFLSQKSCYISLLNKSS